MIDMMEQKTILIVDDENMMREAVASYLEKQGYHVLQAETGTQALSLLEKETVSFVILDLMLPDISGEEICSSICKVESGFSHIWASANSNSLVVLSR